MTTFANSISEKSQLKTDTEDQWKAVPTPQASTMLGEIQVKFRIDECEVQKGGRTTLPTEATISSKLATTYSGKETVKHHPP